MIKKKLKISVIIWKIITIKMKIKKFTQIKNIKKKLKKK